MDKNEMIAYRWKLYGETH